MRMGRHGVGCRGDLLGENPNQCRIGGMREDEEREMKKEKRRKKKRRRRIKRRRGR
jgi:hypothetical protein